MQALGAMGLAAGLPVAGVGCIADDDLDEDWGDGKEDGADGKITKTIKALMDVILPAEYDDSGALVSPGAVECNAYQAIQLKNFIPALMGIGLISEPPTWIVESMSVLDSAFRLAIYADLKRRTGLRKSFIDLSREKQTEIVAEAFADTGVLGAAPMYLFVRTACMIAFLGGPFTDKGLVAIGHPPYEDFADGLAISGYPRTVDGVVDDYTYNQVPPVGGDDVSAIMNPDGDPY